MSQRTAAAVMYLRFVVPVRDRYSHRLTGIFQAAFGLRDRGTLADYEEAWFERLRCWFNRHLPVPNCFSRSQHPHAPQNAICWLKDTATKHIEKVRELSAMLEYHGVATRMLQTNRPGYVVYEDRYQVAAVPFRDTRA